MRLPLRSILLTAALLSAAPAFSKGAEPLTLGEAVRLARTRPVEVIIADERVRESLAQLGQAQGLFLPKIDASASQNRQTRNLGSMGIPTASLDPVTDPFNSFDARLRARQVVLDAAAVARLFAVRDGVRLTKAEQLRAQQDAMALTATLYVQAGLERDRAALARSAERLSHTRLRLAHQHLRTSTGDPTELKETRAEWKKAWSGALASLASAGDARRTLSIALGIDPETPLDLDRTDLARTPRTLTASEIRQLSDAHPDLTAAREAVKQRENVRRAQWAEYFPKISAIGEYGLSGADPSDQEPVYLIGLEASVPLFDAGERGFKAAEAASRERQAAAQLDRTQRKIPSDIRTGLERLAAADRALAAEELAFSAAQERADQTAERVRSGSASRWDGLAAAYRAKTAWFHYRESAADYLLALIGLLRAEGNVNELSDREPLL